MLIGNVLGVAFRKGTKKIVEYLMRQEFKTDVNPHPLVLAGEVGGTHPITATTGISVSGGELVMTVSGLSREVHASNGVASTGFAGVQLWPRATVGLAFLTGVPGLAAADSSAKLALHGPNSSSVLVGVDYRTFPSPTYLESSFARAPVGFLTGPTANHDYAFVTMGMNQHMFFARNAGEPRYRLARVFHTSVLAQTVTNIASMVRAQNQSYRLPHMRVLELGKADPRFLTFEGLRLSTQASPAVGYEAQLQSGGHGNVEVEVCPISQNAFVQTFDIALKYQDANNMLFARFTMPANTNTGSVLLISREAGVGTTVWSWTGAGDEASVLATNTTYRFTFYVDTNSVTLFRLTIGTNNPHMEGTYTNAAGFLNGVTTTRLLNSTSLLPTRISIWPRYVTLPE